MINLEWYRIFLHTAKLGNLTRAAEALHITQPSVSYAIKQLEEQFGVKLFNRQSKGVTLTVEGQALLQYVEQSLNLLDAGERRIASLRTLETGELRIGASGPIIKHLLLAPLDKLRELHPGVRIRLSQEKTSVIKQQLIEGQLDLGFIHLPYEDPSLSIERMADIQDCFVVGAAYKEWTKKPLTATELLSLPLLLLSRESSTRLFIEHWFEEQGCRLEVDIELNSTDMLIELAGRGYGAAFVTRSFVQEELSSGKLFELSTSQPIPMRSIAVASNRGSALSLIAERFMELL